MALNRERITLNPFEESLSNMPLEVGGDRFGHGIFIQPNGSQWSPPPAENPQLAQSVDTEGGLAIATTVGLRQSPVLKIQIIEPNDPAAVNYVPNPQMAPSVIAPYSANAYDTLNYETNGTAIVQLVRDLVGFDYALLVSGTATQSVGTTTNLSIPSAASGQTWTAGVWLKGAVGGEQVQLQVTDGSASTSVTLTLSTYWQWYTATVTFSAANPNPSMQLVFVGSSSVYTTGWALVNLAALTEYFDGTFPGCAWLGSPNNSPSTRPAPGGPRLRALISELEETVKGMSQYRSGTVRRTTPDGKRVTFDVINAILNWDDTSQLNAGVAKGTLTFTCQPYGRGPEINTFTDAMTVWPVPWYTVDAGATTHFTTTGSYLNVTATGVECRFIYTGGEYPVNLGEMTLDFVTPSSLASGLKLGVILKRNDASNYIEAYLSYNGTSWSLNLDKIVKGVRTNLLTGTPSITTTAEYFLRVRLQRQGTSENIYCELLTSNAITATPATTLGPHALSTAELTQFGSLVAANTGWVMNVPGGLTGTQVRSFIQAPYLARERSLPGIRFSITGMPGSAPGLGRMVISDCSITQRHWVRWGQQHNSVEAAASTNDFYYVASALTPGSTAATPSGGVNATAAYANGISSSGNIVLYTTIGGAGGSAMTHVGTFEVYARVYLPASNPGPVTAQFAWGTGFVIANTNAATSLTPTNAWVLLDLGSVYIPKNVYGASSWQGKLTLTSSSSTGTGYTGYVDYLVLVPLDDGSGVGEYNAALVVPPLNSAGAMEVRWNQSNSSNSNILQWAPTPSYVGDYMRIPMVATYDGVDNIVIYATDGQETADGTWIDGTASGAPWQIQAQVNVTPRYLQVPGA